MGTIIGSGGQKIKAQRKVTFISSTVQLLLHRL